MNEKFTPGPWARKGRSIIPKNQSDQYNVELVCRIHENRFTSREDGNACLIAAAPEMYEMLESLLIGARELLTSGTTAEMERILEKARGEE